MNKKFVNSSSQKFVCHVLSLVATLPFCDVWTSFIKLLLCWNFVYFIYLFIHSFIYFNIVFMYYLFNVCMYVCMYLLFRATPVAYGSSRLGLESEPQLLAYATATAMQVSSHVWGIHHSSGQCWFPHPQSEARDWTCILMDTSWIPLGCATMGNPEILCFLNKSLPFSCILWVFIIPKINDWIKCLTHWPQFF